MGCLMKIKPCRLVAEMRLLAFHKDMSAFFLAKVSGVSPEAMSAWKNKGVSPHVGNLDAVLNVMGYKLAIVEMEDDK